MSVDLVLSPVPWRSGLRPCGRGSGRCHETAPLFTTLARQTRATPSASARRSAATTATPPPPSCPRSPPARAQDARRLLEENCVDISDADEITAYLNQKPGHWGGVRTLPTVADYVAAAQAWPVGQRGLALGPRNALDYGRFYSEGPATYGRPEHCDRPATGGRVRALEPRAQGKRLRQWLPMLVALGLTLWVVLFMAVYVYAKS